MRILLIEDDALLADGLARALRLSGYVVDIADNGQLADKLLADSAYELAILDLGLPGLDGGEVLRHLRSRQQKTPVLVLSARLAVEERVRVLDLGADDYVVKPVRLDELEALSEADRVRRLQPVACLLPTHTPVQLSPDDAGRFLSGMRRRGPWPDAEHVAVFGTHPSTVLGTAHVKTGELIPERLLSPPEIHSILESLA